MRTDLLLFMATGLLFILLAVPLIRQWVPPNHLYGFRVPVTLKDRDLWYRVNRRTGWLLLLAGIANASAALLLYPLFRHNSGTYGLAAGGVILLTTAVMVALAFIYLHQIQSR